MKTASLIKDVIHKENKPSIHLLLETDTTKEIRIALKKGQIMKEHKTPFPIVVEVFRGTRDFGVNGTKKQLSCGNLITLEEDIPHDLKALEDSIVRLSISKYDTISRVQNITTL